MLSYLCLVRGPVTPVYCDLFEVSDALIYSPLLYILYTVPAKVPAFIPWVIQPDVHNQALACTIILGFKRGLKLEVLFQASFSLSKRREKLVGVLIWPITLTKQKVDLYLPRGELAANKAAKR